MATNIVGEWVKYEKQPGKWGDKDTSYTRLCADLEKYPDTGWDFKQFSNYIYGEFLPDEGTGPSDVYIYYIMDNETKERKPELCLAAERDDGQLYVDIHGVKRVAKSGTTYTPEVEFLPVLLEKLKELNAKDWMIKKYEESLGDYQALERIKETGIKSNEDILTICRNLSRLDTPLARQLIKGGNIQAYYDRLTEDGKVGLVEILCNMKKENLAYLAVLTKANGPILNVREIEVLKRTASSTGLLCLRFAPIEYRQNKDIMLKILESYDVTHSSVLGVPLMSEELQADIDILRSLTRTQPYQLESTLNYLTAKTKEDSNKLLKDKLNNREYMVSLLDMYFRNVIANPTCRKEEDIPTDVLWIFTPEMLEGVEKEILLGPFSSVEEEQMKSKTQDVITLTRRKIEKDRDEHSNNANN